MATPLIPESYTPLTYRGMQETLSGALAEHIERHGLTAGQIAKRWATCRAGHLRALSDPELEPLGVKMLLALAEASGLKVEVKVRS
jgi:hypothetical protein